MEDLAQPTNPAVAALTKLPPALIQEIQDDPAVMEKVARAMAAINLDRLFNLVQQVDASITQKMELQRMLNKMARLEPSAGDATAGGGFSFTINFSNGQAPVQVVGTPQPPAIDAVPEDITDIDVE